MAVQERRNNGYGLQNPLQRLSPLPIVAVRAPTTSDRGARLGQLWVNSSTNTVWCLTSIVANSSTWTQLS